MAAGRCTVYHCRQQKREFTVQQRKQLTPSIEQPVNYRSFVLRVRQVGEKGECSNLRYFLEMS